ncbi:hypothetical protein [Fretibacterium sp. OH1220_COT-178]|uniref:hypothetical protein n=1 Tax=Fretibacterium sp. OH1220_COT-178 TaxID=2491047 RepID=UPI000F5DBB3C|nr:hypothetical protein [Fretibacterium sp. OH1220_COT-178]RRD64071.1 hypothetical protein EII26_08285 [Fretibacterium sp. OH1220_COT-178]
MQNHEESGRGAHHGCCHGRGKAECGKAGEGRGHCHGRKDGRGHGGHGGQGAGCCCGSKDEGKGTDSCDPLA